MKPPGSPLGGRLRQRRLALGLSQQAVAQRAGMERHTVSMLERRTRFPRFGTLQRVARVLGWTGDALLDMVVETGVIERGPDGPAPKEGAPDER